MNKKIITLGEFLFDSFETKKEKHPGGAPCNVAFHLTQIIKAQQEPINVYPVTAIGNDSNGNQLLKIAQTNNLHTEFIQKNDKPTGIVNVFLDENKNADYNILPAAWDYISFTPELKNLLPKTEVFCFGSLILRNENSRETFLKCLKHLPPNAKKVLDINLRKGWTTEIIEIALNNANYLKINEEEILELAEIFNFKNKTEDRILAELLSKFNLQSIALTKGGKGSTIFDGQQKYEQEAPKVNNLVSTVGAGDSWTAVYIYGLMKNWKPEKINKSAGQLAAHVCEYSGAMTQISDEVLRNILS